MRNGLPKLTLQRHTMSAMLAALSNPELKELRDLIDIQLADKNRTVRVF